jgi:hypothetical protein
VAFKYWFCGYFIGVLNSREKESFVSGGFRINRAMLK